MEDLLIQANIPVGGKLGQGGYIFKVMKQAMTMHVNWAHMSTLKREARKRKAKEV